jgi:hypothetical protein
MSNISYDIGSSITGDLIAAAAASISWTAAIAATHNSQKLEFSEDFSVSKIQIASFPIEFSN